MRYNKIIGNGEGLFLIKDGDRIRLYFDEVGAWSPTEWIANEV